MSDTTDEAGKRPRADMKAPRPHSAVLETWCLPPKPQLLTTLVGVGLVLPVVAAAQLVCWPVSEGGNDHYYQAVASSGITWDSASSIAQDKGGYLAAITSAEENAFIFGLIQTNAAVWELRPTGNSWGPWIGGLQWPGSSEPAGGWSWATGEPFGYANWNGGEPNNLHGIEDRIHFWGQQAVVGDVWNDRPASDGVPGFVIEYETHPNAACLSISIRTNNEVEIAWSSRANLSSSARASKLIVGG